MTSKMKPSVPQQIIPSRLDEIELNNFRGFEVLDIKGLARINLIAGKNSVGKTSLLEALFLLSWIDNPGLPFSLNVLRGGQQNTADAVQTYGYFFRDGNVNCPIILT